MNAPVGIRIRRDADRLELTYEEGHTISLTAELLRVLAPTLNGQTELISGKRRVVLHAAEPVGIHALRLRFSDGFDSGFYSWEFLEALGREQRIRWRRYLRLLEDAGLSRD